MNATVASPHIIRAPRGPALSCKGWHQEAAMRMLMNNLDPEVAERPEELIVYGGGGKAARNWECYERIIATLRRLENDETLLVQSGKPVGVFKTHDEAPRVLIANAHLVPRWATWDEFRRLDALGLTMYGQMTAGSWIYIGTQGILQGTYETFAELARQHFGGTLAGRLVVTGGLGGMGGAQPLAATMNGAAFLGVDVDESRIRRRVDTRYCDAISHDLDDALRQVQKAREEKRAFSVGLVANVADVLPELVRRGVLPDVVTDQTSAHDLRVGYIPRGLSLEAAAVAREKEPGAYDARVLDSMVAHVEAMLALQKKGAVVFDYGNNLRGQVADRRGMKQAFEIPGFVPAFIRPLFCRGAGPFRWAALSGDPKDIAVTDDAVLETFPHKDDLARWIHAARERVAFQGLPARICWLEYGERAEMGARFNWLVKKRKVQAPIVIGRDHLDTGSVASPNRETEGMKDGSDAIADWPLLNAMLNTACGASWVSLHHGGGVGIGYSIHAGMVVVADGTERGGSPSPTGADRRSGHRRHAPRRCGVRPGHRDRAGAGGGPSDDCRLKIVECRFLRTLGHLSPNRQSPIDNRQFPMPLLRNIGLLATCRPGGAQGELHSIARAALVWDGATIRWVGPEAALPEEFRPWTALDAGGRLVIPGLVDCHTHLGFGGWRADEFEQRIQGRSYLDIARAGGGIAATVARTRAMTEEGLQERCRGFLAGMLQLGVTTVECKSGYGLDVETELRLLRAYRALGQDGPQRIVATYLGAHVVPGEFRHDREGYLRLMIDEVIPRVARDGLARFCDAFVEETAFTATEARAIFRAARANGLLPKLHADQITSGGGAELASEVRAASADHLEQVSPLGIVAMASTGVVAVSLPIATEYLGLRPMPARRFIEAGVPVAVATDFNPGSSPSYHLPLAMTLACTMQQMTPAEVLKGTTIIAARATRVEEEAGSIEPGKAADFAVIDAPDVNHWLYHFRPNACLMTVAGGRVVWGGEG